MNSRLSGDAGDDNLIHMTYTWHAFFSGKLPLNPGDVFISKHGIYRFDAGRGQKSVEFFRIWN